MKTLKAVDTDRVELVKSFIDSTATEARLRKGLDYMNEMGIELTVQNTGKFVQWVNADIAREEADTIDDLKLSKSELSPISKKSGSFYLRSI